MSPQSLAQTGYVLMAIWWIGSWVGLVALIHLLSDAIRARRWAR